MEVKLRLQTAIPSLVRFSALLHYLAKRAGMLAINRFRERVDKRLLLGELNNHRRPSD
jgi:hypothetical protein